MAAVDDFDQVLEQFKQAGNEFMKGNPKPVQNLFSHRDDVTLANPFGPPARGWDEVAKTQERGASYYRDGEIYAFETVAKYVTPELACILWIERDQREGGRSRGAHTLRSSGHDDPQARRRYLEGRASACRPHNLSSASGIGDTGVDLPLAERRRIPILSNSVNSAAWCQLGDTFSTALSPCLWTAFHSPSSRRKIRVARIISSVGSGRPLNRPRQRSMKTP